MFHPNQEFDFDFCFLDCSYCWKNILIQYVPLLKVKIVCIPYKKLLRQYWKIVYSYSNQKKNKIVTEYILSRKELCWDQKLLSYLCFCSFSVMAITPPPPNRPLFVSAYKKKHLTQYFSQNWQPQRLKWPLWVQKQFFLTASVADAP